ncbi:MAG: helix-turn-helix domain-containing protein [bacterium]|nr:helix-turn-helix domain-containing protein [bacterium]
MNILERRRSVKAISAKIRAMRVELRISPDSMANHLGVARSSYNGWGGGEALPGPVGLKTLANKFDISLDWLIADKGPMFYKGKKTSPDGNTGIEEVMDDVKELLAAMDRIPLLRFEMLTAFQKFKLKNKTLMEEEPAET